MPAHTFQIGVKNTLTLKKSHQNKPLPIVVVFVNDEGQILGNLVMPNIYHAPQHLSSKATLKARLVKALPTML